MPTTIEDYLGLGFEMGLAVGPQALAAVAAVLVLGWALQRRLGRGGAAPVALAAAYLSAHLAVGGGWAVAFASPGAERLAPLALVAFAVGFVEARLARAGPLAFAGPARLRWRGACLIAVRTAGAVAVAWAVVPARLARAEAWGTSAALVALSLAAMCVLGWAAPRSDARAHLVTLAPALCACGGLAIQFGDFATLGQRALGLGVGASALAGAALLQGLRGVPLAAEGVGAVAAVLGAGVLGSAHLHGNLPLASALLAFASLFVPVIALGRDVLPRGRTALAVIAGVALLGGAAAVAERGKARVEREEREELKSRTPADGGYDPDYGYGSESEGSDSGSDLPY